MLAGIKPTVGRISRYGVIPITAEHDTAGPMTKTVADAAIMLGAMEGASPDPNDAATRTCTPPPNRDYTRFLNANGLKGVRIGGAEGSELHANWILNRGGATAAEVRALHDACRDAVLSRSGIALATEIAFIGEFGG